MGNGLLAPCAVVTVRLEGPVTTSKGTCALIWVGDTYVSGAATPPMDKDVAPSTVGRLPAPALAVVAARSVP